MKKGLAERVTIKAALFVGFGLTLSLWILAGYQVTLRMRDAHRDAAAVSARYQRAQDLLASVRTEVLQASVLVRDALLDPEGRTNPTARIGIERTYDGIDAALARYVPVIDSPGERSRIERMRAEIAAFRDASQDVLSLEGAPWPPDARVLQRRFMPRREAVLSISNEIEMLNRRAFIDTQNAVAGMEASSHEQIWTVFGIAILTSLAIAWLASRHASRLEDRLTAQHVREERITADLQRLSARLLQAQEEEQRRIARELHDEVGQALSAVSVELCVARRRIERAGGNPALLADAQSSADSALRSVRDLSHLLHPTVLDDLGLVAALESYIAEFRRRHRLAVGFSSEGLDVRQPVETERAVYRIVQEALTNMARHAHATAGRVQLQARHQMLRVVIEDDGAGFDAADVERPGVRRGLGLLSIRERVAHLRGTVHIERSAAGGARIRVELPIAESAAVTEFAGDSAIPAPIFPPLREVQHG